MANTTKVKRPHKIFVLRVSIAGSNPEIWRELRVPDVCTLGDLHMIMQIAFDWSYEHMHLFTINSNRYGMIDEEVGFDDEDNVTDEDVVSLYDLKLRKNQKFRYLYDFGDSWEHDIIVSEVIADENDGKVEPPCCLGGERAGPLEDTGGVWGYERMLTILKDPTHKEYKEIHDWLEDYDAENFDIEDINSQLANSFIP
jgi:hypothetical protein